MTPHESFADVMARLRQGDDAAAARVFHRFTQRLLALARLRLDSRIRQKVDAEDVLQSVYRSFFLRHAAGEFTVDTWDSLWTLLAVITVRKCGKWADHFRADKRDVSREVACPPEENSASDGGTPARDPSPPEVVLLTELVEELVREQPERDRAVVALGLQGYTATEISAQLQRPERSVYRVLQRVRARLEKMPAEATAISPPE